MFRFPRTTARALTLSLLGASTLITMAACSSLPATDPDASTTTSQTESSDWPRTVTVPAGAHTSANEITIAAEPQRIVTLDYESTEVVAALGAADHLVLIPEAVLNPALGGHVKELAGVEQTFPVAMEIDPETIISLTPDLVIYSPRHGNEAPIAAVLNQAGIQTVELPDSWSSSASLLTNIELIGEVTGREDEGEALTTLISSGLESATSTDPTGSEKPRVLMLTNQAGRPFITAGDAFPVELLDRAGGESVAPAIGFERTSPISAEHIIEADPDGVVLLDMNGTGDRMFADLINNPAVAQLEGFAADRVLRLDGRAVQALGLSATVDGLQELSAWIEMLPATPSQ